MADEIYPGQMQVRTDDGSTELLAEVFGPAGTSVVELADGTVWEVDHANPWLLVSLVLEGDLERSATARELLGPERFDLACAQLDAQRAAKRTGATLRAEVRGFDQLNMRTSVQTGWASNEQSFRLGEAVVTADLARHESLPTLVRLAAALELLSQLRSPDVAPLLGTLRSATVRLAQELAQDVGPDDVDELGPGLDKQVLRLHALAGRARRDAPELDLPLRRVMDLLDRYRGDGRIFAAMARSRPLRSMSLSVDRMDRAPSPPPEDFQRVEVDGPGQVVVRVARHHEGRWVRVLQVAGLVPLAVAPLEADGVLLRAKVVVPPMLGPEELVVEVLDEGDLGTGPRPLELVRSAVEAGREAARCERLGRFREASGAWIECGRLWAAAEDHLRAGLAARRAVDPRVYLPRGASRPLLADELLDGSDAG